eukprot:TRINITY_DN360_c8_g2_i2.p1 TRINITY_DN360_c8_g2~~TRINITY_DN360_c8_g2_i2.p1  ORF type:complete len:456 (-),score=125.59 TRINITY_DN360_c8_g2_i2:263-1630(-)
MIDHLAEMQRQGHAGYKTAYTRAAIAELKNEEADAGDAASVTSHRSDKSTSSRGSKASTEPEHGADTGDDASVTSLGSTSTAGSLLSMPLEGGILSAKGSLKGSRKSGKGVRFAEEDAVYVYTVNLADFDEVAVADRDGSVKEVTRRGHGKKRHAKDENKELVFVFENADDGSIGSAVDSDASDLGSVGSAGSLSLEKSPEQAQAYADIRALRKQSKLKKAQAKAREEAELRRAFEARRYNGGIDALEDASDSGKLSPDETRTHNSPELSDAASPERGVTAIDTSKLPHSMANVVRHQQREKGAAERAPRSGGEVPESGKPEAHAPSAAAAAAAAAAVRPAAAAATTISVDTVDSSTDLSVSTDAGSRVTAPAPPCPASPEHPPTRKVVKVPPGKRLLRVFMRGAADRDAGDSYSASGSESGSLGVVDDGNVTDDDDDVEMSPEMAMLVNALART